MDRQQVAALDLDVGQEALVAADEARRDEGGRELHAGSCYLEPFRPTLSHSDGLFCANSCVKSLDRIQIRSIEP